MQPLETERLHIRQFCDQDVEEIYSLVYADAEVKDAWSGYRGSLSDFRLRFATDPVYHAADGFGYLAITLKQDRQLLGLMGFQKFDPDEEVSFMIFEDPQDDLVRDPAVIEVELTYALGRAYWGHGYATEAGKAIIPFGFQHLHIARIINAVVVHQKHRSRHLMKRLGFRIVNNLNPNPVKSGPFQGSPGVIGILNNPSWEAKST